MTSIAWVPIEPVEPTMLTVAHWASPDVQRSRKKHVGGRQARTASRRFGRRCRRGREQAAHVLHAEVALDLRLEEIAERGEDRDDRAEPERHAEIERVDARTMTPRPTR